MDIFDRERLSEPECEAVFAALFPRGVGGDDVVAEIAPEGWENSPLLAVFHPSVEQVHRESVQLHRNIKSLTTARSDRPRSAEPTLEEIRASWQERPVAREREVRELVTRCLWDVFSDNHDVVTPDRRLIDIGSFRGAAGFLADLVNRDIGTAEYGYMDFYLGTIWVSRRASLIPVYTMIFRRLEAQGFDWEYVFPRLYAVRLGSTDDVDSSEKSADDDEQETTEMDQILEEGYRESLEEAKDRPPPDTIQAYHHVYGCFPRGWPPWD